LNLTKERVKNLVEKLYPFLVEKEGKLKMRAKNLTLYNIKPYINIDLRI
jgi:hypothetical protein